MHEAHDGQQPGAKRHEEDNQGKTRRPPEAVLLSVEVITATIDANQQDDNAPGEQVTPLGMAGKLNTHTGNDESDLHPPAKRERHNGACWQSPPGKVPDLAEGRDA